jgi:hypothetical protein
MTPTEHERLDRIEAESALNRAALAEIGDSLYRLTSPGRRPPALGQIMAAAAGAEVRPTLRPEEVRG